MASATTNDSTMSTETYKKVLRTPCQYGQRDTICDSPYRPLLLLDVQMLEIVMDK